MSWTSTNWISTDDYLEGYPVPISSENITEFDVDNVYSVWVKDLQIKGYYHPRSVLVSKFDVAKVNTIWDVTSDQLSGYVFPKGVSLYRLGAFSYTDNITNIEIPLSVTSLGRYTFYQSSIESVKIPPDCFYYESTFPDECEITYWYVWQIYVASYTKPIFYLGDENADKEVSQEFEGKISAAMSDNPSSQGGHYITRVLLERPLGGYTLTKPDTSTYGLNKKIDLYFIGQLVRQIPYDVLSYNKYMMNYAQTPNSNSKGSVSLQYRCTDYCTNLLIVYHTGTLTIPSGWSLFNTRTFTSGNKTRSLSIYTRQGGAGPLNPQTNTITISQSQSSSTTETDLSSLSWINRSPTSGDTRNWVGDSKTYWLSRYTLSENTKFKLRFTPSNPNDVIYYYCAAFTNNSTDYGGVVITRNTWVTNLDDVEITMPAGYNSLDIIIRVNSPNYGQGSDITAATFSEQVLITEDVYFGPLGADVLSIYNPDSSSFGISRLHLSQDSVIDSMPTVPVTKDGKRRLYITASIEPEETNDTLVTADNYSGLDLQSLLDTRLSVFYDYEPSVNVTPTLKYYNESYVSGSSIINVIDISGENNEVIDSSGNEVYDSNNNQLIIVS